MSTNLLSVASELDIGGNIQEYSWKWENQEVRVVYETLGNGSPVLLLPAFSTVSMRSEMAGIAKLLSPDFQTFAVDFPGFGDSSRLPLDYQPGIYKQFLEDFITTVFQTPVAVVAAGHSSAYVLELANRRPNLFSRIALIAPTWRGPLPTMGLNRDTATQGKNLMRTPIIGQLLYKLNTLPSFLNWMYGRHVYVDTTKLTPDFIKHKWRNTQQPGARYAPAAFVTGNLDAVDSQSNFLALVSVLTVPLMVIVGESSPPKSRAEMDAVAALPNVIDVKLPGTLGMHEEYANEVTDAIAPFLRAI
ncbi:alpha/beta fold hydrolase [Brunnivagina elsteri]|uniref:Alpha/beta hydrolase n=1 Tax=Brunnivagina elsteri CCALA 953 TaxID=987040 RepID=A0A2A2TBP6_9CYAN|nr:alpha/beta hydrolase [Calothrix elsteri]PAX51056.1 alpha/beta hydrolase [Calothrix elsteri CCALA 953]